MDLHDPRLGALARRVEVLLFLLVPMFAYGAVASNGMERLLFGPAAVGLGLTLVLHRFVGVPGRTIIRWVAGLVGLAFVVGAFGLLGGGIFLMTRGGFGILAGLVALPLSLGLGVWGYTVLAAALSDPERARRSTVDLERARTSPAVKRFDAMYGPGAQRGPAPAPPSAQPDVDGSDSVG